MADASTFATIVALFVATCALIIALAQVIQQYAGTGQILRICDSTVFAGAPGGGHRKWIGRQFCFRVVYSLPRIELPKEYWPSGGPFTPSYARGEGFILNFASDLVPRGKPLGFRLSAMYKKLLP